MKSLKIAALLPLVVLAAACNNSSGGGGGATAAPQVPQEMKAGDKPISQNPWCRFVETQDFGGNYIIRYNFNANGSGKFAQYSATPNGTRLGLQGELPITWVSNDTNLAMVVEGQTENYSLRLDTATKKIYLTRTDDQAVPVELVYRNCP